MQTTERPKPPSQFHLRLVVFVLTSAVLVLSLFVLSNRIINGCVLGGVIGCFLGAIAVTAFFERKWLRLGLFLGGGVGGVAFVPACNCQINEILALVHWVLRVETVLPALFLGGLVIRVLCVRSDSGVDARRLRNAARWSLGVLTSGALAIGLSGEWQALRGFANPRTADGIALAGVAIVLLAAFPWLLIDRRRAAGPDGRPFGRWDTAAKSVLWTGAMLGPACLAAVLSLQIARHFGWIQPRYSIDGVGLVVLAMAYVGHVVAIGLFTLGFVIETWRDRWHPVITILGATYFVAIWGLCQFVWL